MSLVCDANRNKKFLQKLQKMQVEKDFPFRIDENRRFFVVVRKVRSLRDFDRHLPFEIDSHSDGLDEHCRKKINHSNHSATTFNWNHHRQIDRRSFAPGTGNVETSSFHSVQSNARPIPNRFPLIVE